ncbi:MAG: OmpA family protein, partial [Hyphomicrobiaceae bacterium]
GRIAKIRYEIPTGRSSLEVMRNYENALKAKGFEVVFGCVDRACFRGALHDPYLLGQQVDTDNGDSSLYFDRVRYMLVRLGRSEAPVYAGILTGEDKQRITAFVTVAEVKAMDDDKIVFLDAGEMGQAIAEKGRVSLYGVLFDYDKDIPRPQSQPTLAEIAKLLKGKAGLRLEIVGHTDGHGTPEYNMDLSRRRAANITAALVRDYGIPAGRLTSSGAGLASPIAPNHTSQGRARNRRVELVAK